MFKPYQKFIFLYVAACTILISFSFYTLQARVAALLAAEQTLISNAYQAAVNSFKYQSEILYINRINRPEVIALLKQAQDKTPQVQQELREKLHHQLIDMYQTMQQFQLNQLHFHLPDNSSFLRFHRPEIYGDDLTEVRKTVAYVNQFRYKVDGFEEGRLYNGYRFVFPLFDEDTYLGSIETSVSMTIILQEMNKNIHFENDFIIQADIVNNAVFETEHHRYQSTEFDQKYLHESSIQPQNRALINQLMQRYLTQHKLDKEHFNSLQFMNGQFHLLNGMAIPNAITQQTAAYILSTREHDDVKALYIEFLLTVLAILIVLFIFIKILYKTEQQKRQLQHKQEIHDRIESLSALGSWEINQRDHKITWSNQLYKLLDYSVENTQPTFEAFLNKVHPADKALLEAIYEKVVHGHLELSFEHRILWADGTIRMVKQTISQERNAKGLVTHTIGMVLDVSGIKLFEAELKKARNSYETLLQNLPEIIYRSNCDLNRSIQYINDAVLNHLGYAPILFHDNHAQNLNDLIHPADRDNYLTALEKSLNDVTPLSITYRMLSKNGDCVWVHEFTQIKHDENGCHLEGIIQNRTHEIKAQENLQKIIDLQDSIVILTTGETIFFANKSFFSLFAYDDLNQFLMAHQCVCDLFIPRHNFFSIELIPTGQTWTEAILSYPQAERIVLIKNQYTQELQAFSVYINPFDEHQEIIVLTDVTDSLEETEKLRKAAEHDTLTGLYNRGFIANNFSLLTQGAKAKNLKLALIIFDIDHFKIVNDTYGHNCGDEVLQTLAQEVEKKLRTSDVLVRWGGEEFFVLSEVTHLDQAVNLAEHLRIDISNITFDCAPSIHCSFGVTLYEEHEELDIAVERADNALYQAKNTGRNRVCSLIVNPGQTT